MLNPAFSHEVVRRLDEPYVLPEDVVDVVLSGNAGYATGAERRLQRVYEDEIWRKLRRLAAGPETWAGTSVLDAACGTGFLAYHLLARAQPASLVLADISPAEIAEAERLLHGHQRVPPDLRAVPCDLTRTPFADESFDVVIGNSFLHHFASVPAALAELRRILRPGGRLIALHEPTPPAFALESGHPLVLAAYLLRGRAWIDRMRYVGPGVVGPDRGDVWVFERDELPALLREAGFGSTSVEPWHLTRPVVVGVLRLHLGEHLPRLRRWQTGVLGAAVRLDDAAARVLPARAFGSLSVVARRS